uniref:Transposase n=1 Tax=Meloidogyne hapla TaxID=6305 RepID=A0A1I8BVV1_MELHA
MTLAEKQLLEDSIRGRYDLYHIYYSKQLVPHYLQTQLEQQVINPNFKQIFDSIGYNKNLTQMQKIGRIIIPPQRRRFGHLASLLKNIFICT